VFLLHSPLGNVDETIKEGMEHLEIKPYETETRVSHFDLMLHSVLAGDKIVFALEYSTALFEASTIEKMGYRYKDILEQISDSPEILLKEIACTHGLLTAGVGIVDDMQEEWAIA